MGKKVALFITGRDFNLYRSRLPVMRELRDRGWEVHAIAQLSDEFRPKLESEGFHLHGIAFDRSKVNIFSDLGSSRGINRVIKSTEPRIVHFFNPKPILLGGLFSKKKVGQTKVCTVTGAGYLDSGGIKSLIIRTGYQIVLSRFDGISFENTHDRNMFSQSRLSRDVPNSVYISSGVDISRFNNERSEYKRSTSEISFLFASRLLWSKGIRELVEASKLLKLEYKGRFKILIAGEFEKGHKSAVSESYIAEAQSEGLIEYIGKIQVDLMPEAIHTCDVVLLPSYREGFSKYLMEGASAGKALLATDIPGCREIVSHGDNGFLVPPRDAEKLYMAMVKFIKHPYTIDSFGAKSLKIAKNRFSTDVVVNNTLKFYTQLGCRV